LIAVVEADYLTAVDVESAVVVVETDCCVAEPSYS